MIIQNNQLNPKQQGEVLSLSQAAQLIDHDLPMIYSHLLGEPRQENSNLLYYQENKGALLGFLSVYFFYEDACEISLLVHPDHRHQGIATQLLQTICPALASRGLKQVIFSCPPFNNPSTLGFSLLNSDYRLVRVSREAANSFRSALTITKANLADLDPLVQIDVASFGTEPTLSTAQFLTLFKTPSYTLYLAHYQQQPLGKVHLRWDSEEVTLSDLAILPAFQQQGFGSELLAYAINQTLLYPNTRVSLDVSLTNQSNALNLYLRHGFKIIAQYDYWAIPLSQLLSLLFQK